MLCLARKVCNYDMETMAVMDIVVRHNAFGRQVDSFETDLLIPALGDEPFPAIFLRAPFIERAEPQVEILARLPSRVVVPSRQGELLVTAFHPELTSDLRLRSYFLKTIVPIQ
jgi:5'-phosphate synthase pdxT subunit